jgi:hypothetical protein
MWRERGVGSPFEGEPGDGWAGDNDASGALGQHKQQQQQEEQYRQVVCCGPSRTCWSTSTSDDMQALLD